MLRVVALLLVALAVCGFSRGDDLQGALALERTMQKVIRDVEPAVACILVSRSDAYRRSQPQTLANSPGKLGGFMKRPGKSLTVDDKQRKKLDMSDPAYVPESFGSGVVIDARGLILTNYHVVKDATKIFVRLPGRTSSYADIHAADPRSDLAVLRLLAPGLQLKTIPLGDGGACARGQFVLSIANPFAAGFRDGQPSASWGIISNLRRRVPADPNGDERTYYKTLHHFGTLLQTDAKINLGCSGGALVNLHGDMIGLTTALAAIHGDDTPGGFAVPIDAGMRRIIDVLRRGEEVDYGFLGVSFAGRLAEVLDVTKGSPANRQGLLRGDVIEKVNDMPIRDVDDLFLALGTQMAGSKVKLQVFRRGKAGRFAREVTLAKFYVPGKIIASSLGARPFFRGLRVDYTSLLAFEQRDRSVPPGVLITEIQPASPATNAKLNVGDIITRVNGRLVGNPADFYREVAGLAGPVELTLEPLAKVIVNP